MGVKGTLIVVSSALPLLATQTLRHYLAAGVYSWLLGHLRNASLLFPSWSLALRNSRKFTEDRAKEALCGCKLRFRR
jgi:hypothetical protein